MSAIAMSPRGVVVDARRPVRVSRSGAVAVPAAGVRPVRVPTSAPEARARVARTGSGELRLTRRGRLVVVLLALLVVLGGVMGGRAVAEDPQGGTPVQTYAVQAGDTLWQIAASVAAPGEDVRDVVIELQELNGMETGDLTAGQVLLLPADS